MSYMSDHVLYLAAIECTVCEHLEFPKIELLEVELLIESERFLSF